MTWQDVYKLPLEVDKYCPIITWTADKQRAFDWCVNVSPEKQQELIDAINGTKQHQFKYKFYREDSYIFSENPVFGNEPVLSIRGWGYLTGTGGLHLPSEKAAEIQDSFADYIVERLNNKTNV